MPGFHIRTDQTLHAALVELARAEGLSLNSYLVRLARADVNRRRSLAFSLGLDWRCTDAELVGALSAAVAGVSSSLIAGEAQAQQRPTGRTDSDSGSYADLGGYGRTGRTDSDPYDRAGYGIGGGGGGYTSGCSDSDGGPYGARRHRRRA